MSTIQLPPVAMCNIQKSVKSVVSCQTMSENVRKMHGFHGFTLRSSFGELFDSISALNTVNGVK